MRPMDPGLQWQGPSLRGGGGHGEESAYLERERGDDSEARALGCVSKDDFTHECVTNGGGTAS